MQTFSRGQKGKLQDLGLDQRFSLEACLAQQGMAVDAACFGLDAQGKLSDDRFMVFFNQLQSPQAAITLGSQVRDGKLYARFALVLDALPASLEKLVFVASIDGQGTMQGLAASSVQLQGTQGACLQFLFAGSDFQQEKAVILAEIYRRDGLWRFAAVGQGFNGGLSALLTHFGGSEISAAPPPASPPAPAPVPTSAPAPSPTPAPAKKISLSKVTLEKRGDKVSLEKQSGQQFGRMHVNLNWAKKEVKSGFLGRIFGAADEGNIDLDLGCLYQMKDGRPGAVQALGNAWGNFDQPPFIKLDADDRSGAAKNGENLYINGQQFEQIRRILIYAFIYEGVANWAAAKGVVTLHIPEQPPIEVQLDQGHTEIMCAIAMLENNGGKLQVTKLVEYFAGQGKITAHQQMDERYGFGLRWGVGQKD